MDVVCIVEGQRLCMYPVSYMLGLGEIRMWSMLRYRYDNGVVVC